MIFRDNEEDLVVYRAKANFRVLGKELGSRMKAAAEKIAALASHEIAGLLGGAQLELPLSDGKSLVLTKDKLEIERVEREGLKVLNEGTLTLALDTEITEELLAEGYVRDLVRGVQNLRKESGLEVTDRIRLRVGGDESLKRALDNFTDFVRSETLAVSVAWEKADSRAKDSLSPVEADDKTWLAAVERA